MSQPKPTQTASPPPNRRLARLFVADALDDGDWEPAELESIARHQWSAPIEIELGGLPPAAAERMRALAGGAGLLFRSYAELFQHPSPPPDLLLLVKDFAKAHATAADSPLPRPVALALYYSAIFAGLVRHGSRTTQLDDAELGRAAAWLARQPWLDPGMMALAQAVPESLRPPAPPTTP